MNNMLERLETSDRERRRFVADASHELRNSVATLRAGVEIAAADSSGNEWNAMGSSLEATEVDLDDVLDAE